MVWGVEVAEFAGKTANEVANACVLAAYRGDDSGRAVHLMGPLAKKVIRIAPPLTITEAEARDSVQALGACFAVVERELSGGPAPSPARRPRPKKARAVR